jgi:hypothetical protein
MVLVMRHLFDPVADALAAALGPRLRSLTIESWLAGCRLTHTVGKDGVTTRIHQHAGAAVVDASTAVVLNRVRRVPVPAFDGASTSDRDYAAAEAAAAFWSCLEGLHCPVLNSVAALRPGGHAQSALALADQAARAGLRPCRLRMTTRLRACEGARQRPAGLGAPALCCYPAAEPSGMLWIVDQQVLGKLDGVEQGAALAFAQRIGLGFGVLLFAREASGPWRWAGFDAVPPQAPPEVMAALAVALHERCVPKAQGAPA